MAQVPDLLTVEEAADVLRIGRTLAYQLATGGARRFPVPARRPAVAGAEQGARGVGGRPDHMATGRPGRSDRTRVRGRPSRSRPDTAAAHAAPALSASSPRADLAAPQRLTVVAALTRSPVDKPKIADALAPAVLCRLVRSPAAGWARAEPREAGAWPAAVLPRHRRPRRRGVLHGRQGSTGPVDRRGLDDGLVSRVRSTPRCWVVCSVTSTRAARIG